ncbi:MAG: DHH family phosphoesterase [Bacilli bacterium]
MNNYKEIKEVLFNIPDDKLILLAGHECPDMDSIGSTLALTRFLNKIGKKAFMLLEEKELKKLDWFKDNSYIISSSNENPYCFIFLDTNRKSRTGVYEKYFDNAELTINIDHHENNKVEAKYVLSISEISATSEIIYNFFKMFDIKIDKKTAELLYAGLITDTYCFFQRTTSLTFMMAAELLEYDIDYSMITMECYSSITNEEANALTDMLSNINYNEFHYIIINKKNDIYQNINYTTIFKKLVFIIRNIKEIKLLGIFMLDDDNVIGEYRSNCDIEVDKLAQKLNGGGHKKSSGFVTNLSINEVIDITKDYIKSWQQ